MSVVQLSPEQSEDAAILERKQRSLFEESLLRLMRNKVAVGSLVFIFVLTFFAFFSPFMPFIQDPIQQNLTLNNAIPEWMLFMMPDGAENYATISDQFVFGADQLGRGLWARAIHGARISLSVAFVASTVSLLIGTVYGLISGYAGGKVDNAMMRFVDFLYGFPFLIVIILMQAFFKAQARQGTGGVWAIMTSINNSMGGMFFMFIAIGLIGWIGMARIARGQVLSLKKKEFVEAARSIGAKDTRILQKHLFPNILGPLIVAETMAIPGYIFTEAFLSFIGLGVDPPTPSWGIMLSEAVQAIRSYPNQMLVPAVLISLTTLAFNFFGDGLRDAFDPKQKR